MPDTLKAQHTARLTRGHVLYSDMGRVLCPIMEDSVGWHDTITGHMDAPRRARKFGEGSYQELRNDFYRNTRDNFLVELGKYDLGKRDMVPNVNFFVKVAVDDAGQPESGSPLAQRRAVRGAARGDEHAGGALEHAAPARSGAHATRPSPLALEPARAAPGGAPTTSVALTRAERARLHADRELPLSDEESLS